VEFPTKSTFDFTGLVRNLPQMAGFWPIIWPIEGGMAGIRKALMDALRLLTFKGGGVSPTKAEAVRLLVQVVEVLDGERGEVAEHQPSAVFRSPREGERRTIVTALKRCAWNQSEAARQLGLSRATFADRCRSLRIELPARAKIRKYTCEELAAAMRRHHGRKSDVARALGLSRPTLDRQLREAGVRSGLRDLDCQEPSGET
jgi:DNA-binding NtrC family response regulator